MNVLVKQKIWTLRGRKYIVSVADKKKYIIEDVPFSLTEYEIKDYKTWKVIGSIKNKIKFKADAIITIRNKEYRFTQEKFNKMTYQCSDKQTKHQYTIQGNHGVWISIFKNNEQIGFWKKKSFVILSGNKYDLLMNFDEDPILLSSFAVLVDNYRISIKVGGDVGWELGNMGKGLTEFNANWTPKGPDDNNVYDNQSF